MNQLPKAIVSWVSVFGGVLVVVATRMPFARAAIVTLNFRIL
ncbi:hypothetical protein HU200_054814 [Digitaria exilis]|uniref:Uncharacterized protein n=1 Tax=Digitaria exilis TaxID=1010633 RepID=A0A835E286_9POAL|nr:hypothetical protein HU200_054814 [Digitaria exilis]